MASYVDYAFYTDVYKGKLTLDELDLDKASRQVNHACYYRISSLEALTDFQAQQVKLATCAQANYDGTYGELAGYLDVVGGYSIGDVSVSGGGKGGAGSGSMASAYGLCEEAYQLLLPTGLLDRRV